jgi:hypothetical protein
MSRGYVSVFLHRQDIGWSRSCIPVLRWSCKLWRTTKHTIVYPSSDPFYKVIALRSAFLILKMNSVIMVVSRELEMFAKWNGKMFLCPLPEGRGSFIAGRRLDNYKLIISISTKGFTWPVDLDLRRPVRRGLLVLPWPSCLFRSIPCDEGDNAREGSWGRCLVGPAFLEGQAFLSGRLM